MTQSSKGDRKALAQSKTPGRSRTELPGWTKGLRQLYDKVVDEDIPDSFRDLLARLDDPGR